MKLVFLIAIFIANLDLAIGANLNELHTKIITSKDGAFRVDCLNMYSLSFNSQNCQKIKGYFVGQRFDETMIFPSSWGSTADQKITTATEKFKMVFVPSNGLSLGRFIAQILDINSREINDQKILKMIDDENRAPKKYADPRDKSEDKYNQSASK